MAQLSFVSAQVIALTGHNFTPHLNQPPGPMMEITVWGCSVSK